MPSRRFRIKALVPYLCQRRILLDELCPRISSYPPIRHIYRPPWLAASVAERMRYLWRATGYDVVILQRELISTLATLERFLPRPMVFDIDDAIFLRRRGVAAKKIASNSALVVCGNSYLADNFSKWNDNVAVIPTGVDTESLRPLGSGNERAELTIGWIGTRANYPYLETISPALTEVLKSDRRVTLQIVSNTFPEFLRHLGNQLDFRQWQPGIERELLPRFSVGIMPLRDDDWGKGKCAFKMLQYMAVGIPVVVSPVGVNAELLRQGDVGLAAVTCAEWSESLTSLLRDERQRTRLGGNGRRLAVANYSLPAVASLWRRHLERIL